MDGEDGWIILIGLNTFIGDGVCSDDFRDKGLGMDFCEEGLD